MNWTSDQIIALAPDAGAAQAGRGLANPRKWVSMGQTAEVLWGLCQGSGKNPYQVRVDLTEPAFKCSCPSRKFPCKHGLGLFLMLATHESSFTEKTVPDWVTEWLESRAARAEKKVAKEESQAAKPVDVEAQAKRAAQREAKVEAGLKELDLWLCDLVRNGLAAVQRQSYGFWETMAARMVDAQAPGLARQLREMAGIGGSGSGWTDRLLERIARLHLLIAGYQRIESLSPEIQNDIRTAIGWTQNQQGLLAQSGVSDRWFVFGQRMEEEDRLRVQRSWLWGETTQRSALILNFAAAGQPLDVSLAPGQGFEGELVYFPGSYPQRAVVKDRKNTAPLPGAMPGFDTIADLLGAYGRALASLPWIELFAAGLPRVTPLRQGDSWHLRDEAGRALPVHARFPHGWRLLALSGGRPLSVFGEWDGNQYLPLSVLTDHFIRF